MSWRQRFSTFITRPLVEQPEPRYSVAAAAGFEILNRERPEAARWWQKKWPESLLGRYCFVFEASNCEELNETPA
jgi:hypothetical protein